MIFLILLSLLFLFLIMQMQMQMEHQLHMNGMKMEKLEGRKWRRGERGWPRGIEWEMEMMGGKGDGRRR